jgi:uncharacterized protein
MRQKFLLAVFLMVGLAVQGVGQQAAATSAAATKEQVLKFMEIMHVKAAVLQMFDGMKQQARMGAEQAFRQKVPNATPGQIEKVDAIADEMFSGFPVDEMLAAIVPIYQKHISQADMDAVIAFYSSPVGQRFIKESPAMMSEGMQVGGEISRRQMDEINRRMEQKIEELVKESNSENPKP